MGWVIFLFIVSAIIWFYAKKELDKPDQSDASNNHQLSEYKAPSYIFKPTEVNKKIMRAMLYLAKADGQMRQEELDIIANFLIRMQPEHKDTYIYWITDRIKELKPYSTEEYHNFLRQLDKSSLENLMTWMKSIFNTQKKNHPYEDILISELQQAILKAE